MLQCFALTTPKGSHREQRKKSGRKGKSPASEAGTPEIKAKVARMSEGQATDVETTPLAPVSEEQASAGAGASQPKAAAARMI
jgi:hypothetical protein